MRGLALNHVSIIIIIIIELTDKGSCVVLQDREDYLEEAEKQLQGVDIYEDNDFQESDLVKLIENSNTMLPSLRRKNLIREKVLKFFYHYEKSTNFGKMYHLPKIHRYQTIYLAGQLSRIVEHQQKKLLNLIMTKLIKSEQIQSQIWFRYIGDIFSSGQ